MGRGEGGGRKFNARTGSSSQRETREKFRSGERANIEGKVGKKIGRGGVDESRGSVKKGGY